MAAVTSCENILYVKFRNYRKTSSGGTFCFFENVCYTTFKFCAWNKLLRFLQAADWPTTNVLRNALL